MTVPEIDQDGHLILYDAALPQGKSKRIFHVNGVASDVAKQRRDIEALVWLTLERPFDVVGIHNSTQGIQADLTCWVKPNCIGFGLSIKPSAVKSGS
jgi:hypothetical protein